jgi:hypothetical protein
VASVAEGTQVGPVVGPAATAWHDVIDVGCCRSAEHTPGIRLEERVSDAPPRGAVALLGARATGLLAAVGASLATRAVARGLAAVEAGDGATQTADSGPPSPKVQTVTLSGPTSKP